MSNKCQNWVWEESKTRGNDRIVLVYIADQADDDGTGAYPGIDRIARKTNLPKRTVMRCLDRLETSGALIIHRPTQRGRGHFNSYEVVMTGENPTPSKGDTLTPIPPASSGHEPLHKRVPQRREKARKGAPPYLNGSRSLDPEIHTPVLNASAGEQDEVTLDFRAGSEVQEPPTASPRASADLLTAVAVAAPARHRHELLHDPDQGAGRSALRRRLVLIAAEVGVEAAVAIVAGEWPEQVTSAMAHANARARTYLDGPTTSWRSAGPDPLDGIADAAAALAERARDREAELADEPRGGPPPAWKDELLRRLHGTPADTEAVST